jgi:regulator of sirC expression with transglutaminase-like and TPR domain
MTAGLSGVLAAKSPGNMAGDRSAGTVRGVTDDPTAAFAALVAGAGDTMPLDDAVLLIAAHALPGLDLDAERERLDELAAGVAQPSVDGVVDHLVRLGFDGDRATYHHPDNSLLPRVLDRRRGIPLSLAVVAMEVGRRVDVALLGIGMPGHFLVRAASDPEHFVDLFHGGRRLDPAGCRARYEAVVAGVAWRDEHLEPVGPRAIVTRVLANLANAYRRSGDRRGLAWALDLRLRLPGATDRERRELAVVLGAGGRYSEAAQLLEATGAEQDQVAAQRLRARLN